MKKYSVSYFVKQRFGYTSQPEQEFLATLDLHLNDPHKCPVAHQGSGIELANDLYLEWKKRGQVHWCLFPTPLNIARDLTILMGLGDNHVVFDPGAGLGNLLHAAQERGAKAFGCDFQPWLPEVGAILGLDIHRGDFLDGYQPRDFNVVLTNPPFGKMGEVTDATAAFLDRLAALCNDDVQIGAILPRGFMNSERPKVRADAVRKFRVLHSEPLPPDTFKPLTGISTEMVILQSLRSPSRMVKPRQINTVKSTNAEPEKPEVIADQIITHLETALDDFKSLRKELESPNATEAGSLVDYEQSYLL